MSLSEQEKQARRSLSTEQCQANDIYRIAEALEETVDVLRKIEGHLFQLVHKK